VKKLGFGGRAGISSEFYKCDRFEGKGYKAVQKKTIIKVFRRKL
jgi:hypothetical protein